MLDKILKPPIKNNEHDTRAQGLDRYTVNEISGPVQKRQTYFWGLYAAAHSNRHSSNF